MKTRLGNHHPAPVGAVEVGDADAADRGQVAGHQRQHAGRQERHQARPEGGDHADPGCRIRRVHRLSSPAHRLRGRGQAAAVVLATGSSGPSSVKIATITWRSRSRVSGVFAAWKASCSPSRAPLRSPSSQAPKARSSVEASMPSTSEPVSSCRRAARPSAMKSPSWRLEQLARLVAVAALDQQPGERQRGLGVARVQLDRLAQRLLVAGVGQLVGGGGEQLVEEGVDRRRRDRAGELAHDLAVPERLHGGDAADAERLGDHLVGVDVDLGELDLPGALGDGGLERRGRAGGRGRTTRPRSRPAPAPRASARRPAVRNRCR